MCEMLPLLVDGEYYYSKLLKQNKKSVLVYAEEYYFMSLYILTFTLIFFWHFHLNAALTSINSV